MTSWTAENPERLDSFLAARGAYLSRAKAQAAIGRGAVSVNGLPATKVSQRLEAGDAVSVSEEVLAASTSVEPSAITLPLLHEDDACLVLDKPAGLAVHPGAGMDEDERTILHGIAHLFAERGLPFSPEGVLVHRLDRETTGCLLVAKTPAAHLALQAQFEARTVDKRYLAAVAGVPSSAAAVVDAPIGRSLQDRTRMSVMGASASRPARTTYRTLAATDDSALLECELHTGRTHQIRVHMLSIGHPILGDPTYVTPHSVKVSSRRGVEDLCLHAWKLSFRSPDGGKDISVTAPLPDTLKTNLRRLGLPEPVVTR